MMSLQSSRMEVKTYTRLAIVSPIIVFLAFNTFETPHDCFECYNRLPGVRYSSFQYSAYERNQNLESRYGIGAVRMHENLMREAQKEVDLENKYKALNASGRFHGDTIIMNEEGEDGEDLAAAYKNEKERLAKLAKMEEMQRLEAYKRQ